MTVEGRLPSILRLLTILGILVFWAASVPDLLFDRDTEWLALIALLGWAISLPSLAALLVLTVVARRKRRRSA